MHNPYKDPEFISLKQELREHNCCTVVALWSATSRPLRDCFKFMKANGRINRRGMTKLEWNKALESMTKFKVVKGPYSQRNRITVNQFIKKHSEGTYYVANNGHAFCIKDGEVWDHTEGLRRQITCAYRIYELKFVN